MSNKCFIDGNNLCIVTNDFINLQESEAVFIQLSKEEIKQIKKLHVQISKLRGDSCVK